GVFIIDLPDEQNHRGNQASTGLKQIHTG
ncbi:MAG: hypothetical protein RJA02_1454, partial [Armatimonadota bacterium]